MDHFEVASEVVGAEELLLDAALGRDAHLLGLVSVGQQSGYRRSRLFEVSRV